ncbi:MULTISPECIES: DUF448 domain-containing protein [Sulfurimonadaceae]|uniref:DUF448 domain-containing protein n=1 Tax=Sulfurimonadaceae TaxID=2771471 RepID=UPI0032E35E4E
MRQNYSGPVRMCVSCRKREAQNQLLRLQCAERSLRPYSGTGRSFYLCPECFTAKQTAKALARQCKSGEIERLLNELKEIITDVR